MTREKIVTNCVFQKSFLKYPRNDQTIRQVTNREIFNQLLVFLQQLDKQPFLETY